MRRCAVCLRRREGRGGGAAAWPRGRRGSAGSHCLRRGCEERKGVDPASGGGSSNGSSEGAPSKAELQGPPWQPRDPAVGLNGSARGSAAPAVGNKPPLRLAVCWALRRSRCRPHVLPSPAGVIGWGRASEGDPPCLIVVTPLVKVITLWLQLHNAGKQEPKSDALTDMPDKILAFAKKKETRQFFDVYFYISHDRKTWPEARQICEKLGSLLASFPTLEEQHFLKKEMDALVPENYWIGVYRTPDDHWNWILPSIMFSHRIRPLDCPLEWWDAQISWMMPAYLILFRKLLWLKSSLYTQQEHSEESWN
ncbi:uncharacterized protein LOC128328029 isoform X2 [Hemicordylus capensis]|uniref:uncharacterized protein LOC128328029 isoform X2 n=1 Tax=Hemicordylus capensis TaxID=884348 RepID=UPI002302C68E|nr:uncharacterized protein LOC128328029 isoform X2 [Hemicordylus capensis]